MALAVASQKSRIGNKPRKETWWNKRAKDNAGIPLEQIAREANPTNGHDATNMAYVLVLPDISAASHRSHDVNAAELETHMQDVAEFNRAYYGSGIEQRVNASSNIFERALDYVENAVDTGLRYAARALGEVISLVPEPARRALVPAGLLLYLAAACGSPASSSNTPTPMPNGSTVSSDSTQKPGDLEAKAQEPTQAPTPIPPNFIIGGDVKYDGNVNQDGTVNPSITAAVANDGGPGTLAARLYDSNSNIAFPVQRHEFVAGESKTINFDIANLERGKEYNLRLDLTDTSNKTTTADVPGFYLPRPVDLVIQKDGITYDAIKKEIVIPVKNYSPDVRDSTATDVEVKVFHKDKLIGTAKSIFRSGSYNIYPGYTEKVAVDGISLPPGINSIEVKVAYNDGNERKQYEDGFVVDVPFPDLEITKINPAFLKVNDDGTSSYKVEIGGDYGPTKPDKAFDIGIEISGLEGKLTKLTVPVTEIKDGTFLGVIEVALLDKNSPRYNISATVDPGNAVKEQNEDNNTKALELKVIEPVTATQEELDYFKKAVGAKIHKFENGVPVYVKFYGSADGTVKPDEKMVQNFKDIVLQVEKITNGNLTFRYDEPPANAPTLEAYFLDNRHKDMYILFPGAEPPKYDKASGLSRVEYTPNGIITKARIAVSTHPPSWSSRIPEGEEILTSLHELSHVIGDLNHLGGPIDTVLDSGARSYNQSHQTFFRIDEIILRLLYSPFAEPGRSPDDVKRFIRVTDPSNYSVGTK